MDAQSLRLLLAAFAAEATEIIERLTRVILQLESAPGDSAEPLFDELGRGLHTLKGTAGSIGLDGVAAIAHDLETLVAPYRKDRAAMPVEVTDELLRSLDRISSMVRDASPVTGDEPAEPGEDSEEPTRSPRDAELGWRVSPKQIRELMREVERLRNLRMRIEERRRRLLREIELIAWSSGDRAHRVALMGAARGLRTDGEELGDVANAVEGGIKDIWTLPARMVLEPLERVVRDHCRESGKLARLSFVGAELALDRRVLEALKGPFVHLVRNAIDHGIESPEVRASSGKHEVGSLSIRLEQQGNLLFVEVSDDGRGLDHDRIRRVARDRGVSTEGEIAQMSDGEVAQLVFEPGFSTRTSVSTTSGRGVGLDVVMTEVRALQGHIEVQTTAGQGTRFVLTMPVDLGSSQVLLVRCGDQRFGVPTLSTESVIAVRSERMQVGRTRIRLMHGDHLLPVVSLAAQLGLADSSAPSERQPALIVQSQTERFALVVDEVLGENDVVIRPLPEEQRSLPAYQGVATVASGELLLVLRPDWIAEVWRGDQKPIAATRRVLVVDDSVTARALHRAMLEAAGWTVHAVGGGRQALEHIRRSAYDAVVCDIAMPEMDGFQLTREMRASPEGVAIPIILVSAHDADEDRVEGSAAGADAFLSKRDCASGRLLAEVSKVISNKRAHA